MCLLVVGQSSSPWPRHKGEFGSAVDVEAGAMDVRLRDRLSAAGIVSRVLSL